MRRCCKCRPFRRGAVCVKFLAILSLNTLVMGWILLYKTTSLDETERKTYSFHRLGHNEMHVVNRSKIGTTTESYQAIWLRKRQELLSSDHQRKLYLLAYMRGGSTLLGEAFNQDKRAWYWYEPLNLFYAAHFGLPTPRHPYATLLYNDTHYREMPLAESKKIADHVNSQLSCAFEDLPVESVASDMLLKSSVHLKPYTSCLQSEAKNRVLLSNKAQWKTVCTDTVNLGKQYCSKQAIKGIKVSDITAAYALDCPQYVDAFRRLSTNGSSDFKNTTKILSMLKENGINITETTLASSDFHRKKVKIFQDLSKCQQALKSVVTKCMQKTNIKSICSQKNLTVTKNLRLKMRNIVPTLERTPDIFVVHYLRDPRAIARSQVNLDRCTPVDSCFTKITKRLCYEMYEDLKHRKQLAEQFPGVFLQIRYEDFLTNVSQAVNQMYGHLQLSPPNLSKWFSETVHAKTAGNAFSLKRVNGESRINAWRTGLHKETIQDVTSYTACRDLFNELGYK